MIGHDLIVIGTSAGGVEALTLLVKQLPSDLNAAVIIVLHVPSNGNSVLPRILNRAGNLPVSHAQDGEVIVQGRIYIAPPDYQLVVKPGYLRLARGPKENGHRPAIDPTFRTAARAYGQRVVAVILTGALDDGTAGLVAVKMRGGMAVVQDPDDALYSGMPRSAIENVEEIDYILPLSDIPPTLVALVNTSVQPELEKPITKELEIECNITELNTKTVENENRPGKVSIFACPECGGNLWEIQEGSLLRFRCRTGHAYSAKTLLAEQSDSIEEALWIAFRALEEKASLTDRLAARMNKHNQALSAERLSQQAIAARQHSAIIKELLLKSSETEANGFKEE